MARILVADDEKSVREFVQRALSLQGHSVMAVKDGAEALSLLDRHRFDILLSDIRMPMMDGISLALQVRAEQPSVKIMLMTGYSGELERAHNMSTIVDYVLAKPFALAGLMDALASVLMAGITAPVHHTQPNKHEAAQTTRWPAGASTLAVKE